MKLFWWRQTEDSRNLGDEVGPYILQRRFGIDVQRSGRFHAEFLGTGSILNWVYENREKRATEAPLGIIGSGLMFPHVDLTEVKYLKLFGVRGYLTRSCVSRLDDERIGIGDPGMLISDILALPERHPTTQLGIIPHVGFRQDPRVQGRIEEARRNGLDIKVLDIGTDDFDSFFAELLDCKYILSQSLHGLIFCDALRIPNIWWDDYLLNSKGGRFKFYDYFSSIDRPYGLKLTSDTPLDRLSMSTCSFALDEHALEHALRGIRAYHHRAFDTMGVDHA